MNQKKIEVEDKELAIRNTNGDIAIIPSSDRNKIKDLIKNKFYKSIDKYISSLPKYAEYAQEGGLYPENNELKSLYEMLSGTPLKSTLDNDFKDANEFSAYFSDSNNIKSLYETLSNTPLKATLDNDFKDINEFSQYYLPIKKKLVQKNCLPLAHLLQRLKGLIHLVSKLLAKH